VSLPSEWGLQMGIEVFAFGFSRRRLHLRSERKLLNSIQLRRAARIGRSSGASTNDVKPFNVRACARIESAIKSGLM